MDDIIVICKKKYKKDIVLGKCYSCDYIEDDATYIIYPIEEDMAIMAMSRSKFLKHFITLAEYRQQKIIEVLNG